jgi:hypothetical protein
VHPNDKLQVANVVLEIIVLETTCIQMADALLKTIVLEMIMLI